VESAAKAKTLAKFLGKNYRVKASVGHIKDLPKSKLGIDVERDFTPQYITIRGKGNILKEIKAEAQKADRILLATDPDREGEAIAWHLQNAMRIQPDQKCRVEFHEITKEAVTQAIKQAHLVNLDKVNAQQARRVLDRLVGYNLSPLLWAKVRKGLSAGRVQTVAVRLICDREREIEAFVPEEYWTIDALLLNARSQSLTARLYGKNGKKLSVSSETEKDAVTAELKKNRYVVDSVDSKERRKKASPPFTTSTLQQEASKRINFLARRTMKVAQELYEGLSVGKEGTVGLITYLRTDSIRVAESAQEEARDFIRTNFGAAYVPAAPNRYKSRKSSQDAHEAIRPTSARRTPDSLKAYLNKDQLRLYRLIWERFLASQMTPAVYLATTVEIRAGDYQLRAAAAKLQFPGYQKVYSDNEEDVRRTLPEVAPGEQLTCKELKAEQHFTQPPARYNEASLIKTLEEKSIGRPSTYSPIIETIVKRGYVERRNKVFTPHELGFVVVDLLSQYFDRLIDVTFTAAMEENLDSIEEGKMDWREAVRTFYEPFAVNMHNAEHLIEKVVIEDVDIGRACPQCQRPLLLKHGRYGKFIACSGFPECRYTESIDEEIGRNCPLCAQPIVVRKSKKGRTFYVCKNHKECAFLTWNKPTGEICPVCGDFMVEKPKKNGEVAVVCQNRECKATAP
jgi:DNA topoisomerase-1